MFLHQPNDFLQLKPEIVKETLSDFSKVSTYVNRFAEMNHLLKDEGHKQDYIEKLIAATTDYFEEDSASLLQEIASLFHHNKDWLAHTKELSWSAFNYSRAISIIADAAISDIISEQEASELCDYYGSAAESMFGDWQTLLFSAILGKQLLTPNEDRFVFGANDTSKDAISLPQVPSNPLRSLVCGPIATVVNLLPFTPKIIQKIALKTRRRQVQSTCMKTSFCRSSVNIRWITSC